MMGTGRETIQSDLVAIEPDAPCAQVRGVHMDRLLLQLRDKRTAGDLEVSHKAMRVPFVVSYPSFVCSGTTPRKEIYHVLLIRRFAL